MRDYIKIQLDFSECRDLYDEGWDHVFEILETSYDACIEYNQEKSDLIKLIIFYPHTHHIDEILDILEENEIDITSIIKPINQGEYIHRTSDVLDFSNTTQFNILKGYSDWEQGNKTTVISLDNLDLLRDWNLQNSRMQLSENSIYHIWNYYPLGGIELSRADYKDTFEVPDNLNRITQFGVFSFILELRHEFDHSDKFSFTIKRIPYLNIISPESQSDIQIKNCFDLLCILLSFYWNKRVDYFLGHIRVIEERSRKTGAGAETEQYLHTTARHIFKYLDLQIDDERHYLLESTYPIFYDFIDDIDYTKALFCQNLLDEVVPKVIQSKYVDDSSRFMLLYNVIEKVRNFCLSNEISDRGQFKIKEEYEFIYGNDKTSKCINKILKEIVRVVKPVDQPDFEKNTHKKVSFIKKTGLIDQFDSLIAYLGLPPDKYGIDFKNLIKVRNDLYHGKSVDINILKSYNPMLNNLIGDLILSLLK